MSQYPRFGRKKNGTTFVVRKCDMAVTPVVTPVDRRLYFAETRRLLDTSCGVKPSGPSIVTLLKRYIASVLLLALVLTGRLSPCFCATDPPVSACADHDHSNSTDPDQHERDCSCPTCHVHVCPHLAFMVDHVSAPQVFTTANCLRVIGEPFTLPAQAAEIFTPPKLA